jgi:hypothetical protein
VRERAGERGGGGGVGWERGHRETSQALHCHPKGLSPTTLTSKPFPPQRPHPRRLPRPRPTGVVRVIVPFVVILPWSPWRCNSRTRPKQHGPARGPARSLLLRRTFLILLSLLRNQSGRSLCSQANLGSFRLVFSVQPWPPVERILGYFAFLLFIRLTTISRPSRGSGNGQL